VSFECEEKMRGDMWGDFGGVIVKLGSVLECSWAVFGVGCGEIIGDGSGEVCFGGDTCKGESSGFFSI
jgi:hypothetical protein